MGSDLDSAFHELSDREIAVELDVSEDEVRAKRRESGFLNLKEFEQEDGGQTDTLQLDLELDEMEKRKVQGFLGEKIASLMKNRVVDHISTHLRSSWVLRDKMHLINSSSTFQRYWASGKPRQGEIRIEGRNLKHTGKNKEELKEHVQEKCVAAEEEIFKKFKEVRNPFIDFNFYAVKTNGRKQIEFKAENYSKNKFEENETIKVELPKIEDFKIVMLEVKTTKDDAENLFSKNQRKARDMAKNSPFLEFFSLKVDKEFQELGIPSSFDGKIQKHS